MAREAPARFSANETIEVFLAKMVMIQMNELIQSL